MIKDDFLVKTEAGLYCKYGDFYLDPELPVKNAVISHAHGDHAKGGNINVYCSAFTKDLMLLRYKKKAAVNFLVKQYKEDFAINQVKLRFYPAGHILGSAMILMEFEGSAYLYTGDYKLQEDDTCEQAELPTADVLITESTFANPNVSHPDAEEEIKKLNSIDANILLGVYGLGKAQRITSLINKHCPDKVVHIHHSIFSIHQLYNKYGVELGVYNLNNRKALKQQSQKQVYLLPPLTFNSYRGAVGVARVFASGWEYLQRGNDLSLYISDHVDWADILITIEKVNPGEVWTLHGDGTSLKNFLSDKLKTKIL